MLFTSVEFFLFLTVLFILYYVVPVRFQWLLLLAANAVFYLNAGIDGCIYMGVTIVTSYLAVMGMTKLQKQCDIQLDAYKETWTKQEKKAYRSDIKKKKRCIFAVCIFINLGILAVLKYSEFAVENINGFTMRFIGTGFLSDAAFVLPLGISFYTFQTLGYVIDVYNGKAQAEKNILKMALFTSFFPQLIQGPISRFNDLKKTLYKPHTFSFKTVWFGLERMLWGYFKKIVIADRMLIAVNAIIGHPDTYSGFYVFCGMIFYAIELYADFTGGIDITIGIAQVLGIHITENFERPYFSKNIAEYWRRWHITMGTWFKDYVFYPLSVSMPVLKMSVAAKKRFGEAAGRKLPLYFVTLTVWFLTGLWHGAGWNFIVWGLLNGVIILISQECQPLYERFHTRFPGLKNKEAYKAFQIIRTILLMSVLRMLDCYGNVPLTFKMFISMFTDWNAGQVLNGGLLTLGMGIKDYIAVAAGVVLLFAVSIWQRKECIREYFWKKSIAVQYMAVFILLFIILIFGVYGIGYNSQQFIYNRF